MRRINANCIIAAWLTAAATITMAQPAVQQPQTDTMPPAPTSEVATLLQIQRSGVYASPIQQTLPGDAQSRAWKRYIDSFSHPVPERYISDAFSEK